MFAPGSGRRAGLCSDVRAPTRDRARRGEPAHTIYVLRRHAGHSTGPWTRSDGKTGTFAPSGSTARTAGIGSTMTAMALAGTPATAVVEDRPRAPGRSARSATCDETCPIRRSPHEAIGEWRKPTMVTLTMRPCRLVAAPRSDARRQGALGRLVRSAGGSMSCAGRPGAHLLRVWAWDGRRYRLAVFDVTGASQ